MSEVVDVQIPDIGDFDQVDVIEVLVAPGDQVAAEDSLITLESDKSTMEIPSPHAGVVRELKVAVGDKLRQGDVILTMERGTETGTSADSPSGGEEEPATTSGGDAPQQPVAGEPARPDAKAIPTPAMEPAASGPIAAPGSSPPVVDRRRTPRSGRPHAGPAARRFARELGVDLGRVSGTGPKGRILKSDVEAYVKATLSGTVPLSGPVAPAPLPIDFSRFGETETIPLNRIRKLSGANLHRSWVTVPHVTQFDETDITELEEFRQSRKQEASERGIKLTFMAFLLRGCVAALRKFPEVNASLTPDGESLILKKYCHIGVAVDTPDGLVVPVIRDADQKGLFELAAELADISERARNKKLMPKDMQGAGFSISSLGGIGGTAFTPIVNSPEVAILGVARAAMKPVYVDGSFEPRLILPFCISYDHRVIDGASAARFTTYLGEALSDIRNLLL